ncbi:MAG: alpha-amylase family glycosyl hydrolase [Capsulimonadaceae bacterium]|nr:alpha-amylase family glycosyl hydrolase [Capsulimonadaceae bacterium]
MHSLPPSRNRASVCRTALILTLAVTAQCLARAAGDAPMLTVRHCWPILTAGTSEATATAPGSPVNVSVDDRPLITPDVAPTVQPLPGGGVELTYTLAKGTLVEQITPFAAMGNGAWLQSMTYTNRSDKRQDITGASMRIAPRVKDGGIVWNPAPFWMGELGGGLTLHVAYRSVEDEYSLKVSSGVVETHITAQWRLDPGQSAPIGAMAFWETAGGAQDFRSEAQRWYKAIGIRVPVPSPNWLATAVLYEASAGGHIESRFSDVGGFDAFAHQLDYLHDLGVNAIWYNMPFSFKSGPDGAKGNWNHYGPLDYSKIDEILGGAPAFKRMTSHSKELGIHVLAELVPHGGRSVQAMALKPWWTGKRDGAPVGEWGGADMDYASPPWQDVMRTACQRLARDFDVEGVRIDLGNGDGPNWTSPGTNHASLSTLGGALGMIRAARDGLAAGGARGPVIIPESNDIAEHYAYTALGYGSEFTRFFEQELPSNLDDAAAMNKGLRDLLENERGALPDGAMRLRTLNNHDTVIYNGRVHLRFGVGLSRAFLGVCLAAPGVPMLYQEQEVGDYEALRRMLWARRALPELGAGEPDYFAATFDPKVFTVVSTLDGSRAIGLVNLSGTKVAGRVVLAHALNIANNTLVYDGVSDRSTRVVNDGFDWTLAPYETALIRIGAKPASATPAEVYAGETYADARDAGNGGLTWHSGKVTLNLQMGGDGWTESVSGERSTYSSPNGTVTLLRKAQSTRIDIDLKPSAPTPRLVVLGADRWLVSGRTAIVNDRVLRRHFPFPAGSGYTWNRKIVSGSAPWGKLYDSVAPEGRLWQSILEPLHPDDPGLEFADRAGAGLSITGLSTTARNIVLTDCTDEPESGPFRLETRFYDIDTDLNANVRALGLGSQWLMSREALPPVTPAALHVSFMISNSEGDWRARWSAPRLPVQRTPHVAETDIGPRFVHAVQSTFLPEPGQVAFDGFPPVAGVYQIELDLRRSEASATSHELESAYTVRVDGIEQPLQWSQRGSGAMGNAYFATALTPPIDLSGKTHSISITTARPWCAVHDHFKLVKASQ